MMITGSGVSSLKSCCRGLNHMVLEPQPGVPAWKNSAQTSPMVGLAAIEPLYHVLYPFLNSEKNSAGVAKSLILGWFSLAISIESKKLQELGNITKTDTT